MSLSDLCNYLSQFSHVDNLGLTPEAFVKE